MLGDSLTKAEREQIESNKYFVCIEGGMSHVFFQRGVGMNRKSESRCASCGRRIRAREFERLSERQKEKIEGAVLEDLEWLEGEAQETEAWRGTKPSDVGVFDLGDMSATTIELDKMRFDTDKEHDAAHEYASKRWRELTGQGSRKGPPSPHKRLP